MGKTGVCGVVRYPGPGHKALVGMSGVRVWGCDGKRTPGCADGLGSGSREAVVGSSSVPWPKIRTCLVWRIRQWLKDIQLCCVEVTELSMNGETEAEL